MDVSPPPLSKGMMIEDFLTLEELKGYLVNQPRFSLKTIDGNFIIRRHYEGLTFYFHNSGQLCYEDKKESYIRLSTKGSFVPYEAKGKGDIEYTKATNSFTFRGGEIRVDGEWFTFGCGEWLYLKFDEVYVNENDARGFFERKNARVNLKQQATPKPPKAIKGRPDTLDALIRWKITDEGLDEEGGLIRGYREGFLAEGVDGFSESSVKKSWSRVVKEFKE